ncbi:MAG: sodium:solute symporter [Planctomycetota bacterium]|nr:MAG: sodium:solute symporter [Planctomycetota bacterium]
MEHLNSLDYSIIAVYFAFLVCLGLYLKKKASASIEDYFIGGRSLPWWALGISGMAAWLDITGTMMVTSFLFLLGPRGLFIEFRGGAVLVAAVAMLWIGKWHRRSQCITGAEWMIFRFGNGFGGQFARIVKVIASIVGTIGSLAYLIKGAGLFLSMFLPFSPLTCSFVLIGVATIYTMMSGFYGVVFTDIFQSGIVLIAVIAISTMAILKVIDEASLSALAYEVTGNSEWTSSSPQWYTSMPKGYECYQHLMMFAIFYLMRTIFGGMGAGDEPKYFGARNDRECGTLTFMTICLIMLRWPMMLGFAVLGLFMVKDMFPDQTVLIQASDLIRQHVENIDPSRWESILSGIINSPQNYAVELTTGLKQLLGDNWQTSLHLLSYNGTVNPERILPAVILMDIPMGFRGMILVALIAAAMSTFDSMVNMTTGYFTRDIYQGYLRPKAGNKELIYVSWGFAIAIVAMGFIFGYTIRSINDIWGWLMMGLAGGLLVPTILRLYWWRFNGGGFAIGTAVGLCGAVFQRIMFPGMDERLQFVVMVTIGLVAAIVGTYLTKPTDPEVLEEFYKTTRPFGFWGHLKRTMPADVRAAMTKEHRNDLIALPFALSWQITLFLLPMQLIVRNWQAFWVTFAVFAVSLLGLYIFWYRNLGNLDQQTEGIASESQFQTTDN